MAQPLQGLAEGLARHRGGHGVPLLVVLVLRIHDLYPQIWQQLLHYGGEDGPGDGIARSIAAVI